MRKTLGVAAGFGAIYLFWGATYLAITIGLKTIPPFLLMTLRCSMGGILLLMIVRIAFRKHLTSSNWARAAVSGTLLFLGCHGLLAVAEKRVPSGFAAVILATIPFWIVLLTAVWPAGKKPTRWTVLSLIPGFIGVGTVAWRAMITDDAKVTGLSTLLLVFSAMSWALGTVIAASRKNGNDALSFAGMELLFGAVALVAVSLATGEMTNFHLRSISIASWTALAFLVIAGTVVSFGAYIWLLQTVPASLVATHTFVNPIVAVLLGWIYLHEQLNWTCLVGLGLVTLSIVGLSLQQHRNPRTSNA